MYEIRLLRPGELMEEEPAVFGTYETREEAFSHFEEAVAEARRRGGFFAVSLDRIIARNPEIHLDWHFRYEIL